MAISELQSSFAGGELSPALYARTDLEKFQVGAALLRNFFVDYRGGATNRAGSEFIASLSDLTGPFKLVPFVVSSDASYVLVFADTKVRIFASGVFVVDVTTPYLAADVGGLKYSQSADVLTLTHPSYPPADLSRTSDTTFSYAAITVGPVVQPPTITTMRAPHSGPYSFGYRVTSVDLDGKEESLPSNIGVKHSEGMNELTNRVIDMSWNAPATPVLRYNVYKWGPIDAVTMNPATVWGFIGSSQTTTFTDINIAPDFTKQPPIWGDPFTGGQFQSIVVNAPGSGYNGVSGDWPVIPYVPLTITGDGTGAAGYAVIDHDNGTIVGAFLTNAGRNYTTATITANGEGGTGATFTFSFSDIAPLYPACVSYVQQRRAFAGADLQPETFVLSQPGLYDNFNTTPVALDTDSIGATVASLQVNTIKSLVPVSYGLLAFTSGGCYLISGGGPSAPISPSTISVTQQASPGANDLPPLQVNYDILFGAAKGNRILSAGFAWERQSYTVKDTSELAPHLFDTYRTVDWAWAESPHKIAWVVRDDGRMLSLTYVPEEQVYAWARHDTQGLFKSVCAVPERGEDAVYVIVERHIPNADGDPCWVSYLERFASRQGCCIFDAWFLDCALSLSRPTPASPLFLQGNTAVIGQAITLTSYDPCATPSGNFGGRYLMEAVENFDGPNAALQNSNTPPSFCFTDQDYAGMSYDPIRRLILYNAVVAADAVVSNDTGFRLWNGSTAVELAGTINYKDGGNLWTCAINIDTRAVTWYRAFNTTSLVPNGIGGSDGTDTIRFTDTLANFDAEGPRLVDPWTGNLWMHSYGNDAGCSTYLFRVSDNYRQVISPFLPPDNGHMVLQGISPSWTYVENQATDTTLELTPRLITSDEVAADYLLSYASFSYAAAMKTSNYHTAVGSDGSLYYFACQTAGVKHYKLWKFTQPSSAPFGGPVVGGGFTDITPWGAATGPNTSVSAYTQSGTLTQSDQCVIFSEPGTDELVCISKMFAQDTGAGVTNPNLFSINCTYVSLTGPSFTYHPGFIKGYMTAAWVPTTNPALAAYSVINFREVNTFLDKSSYDYTINGQTYTRRRLFVTVQPVVAGVWTPNAANNQVVICTYDFISGAAPVLISFIPELGWDTAYPTYSTAIGSDFVVENSLAFISQLNEVWADVGVYDEITKAYWWSGLSPNANMCLLNPTFANRQPRVSGNQASSPFLRLSADLNTVAVDDVVQVGCGKITVTEITDTQTLQGVVLEPLDVIMPDDPDNTAFPVIEGTWTLTTPVAALTGLEHLNGKQVWALADGNVFGPLTVAAGSITLPSPATNIVAGLRYTQQIQTLYLTADGINQGTEQGKRKKLSGVTLRVDCTRGLKAGDSFAYLTEVPGLILAGTTDLFTGDARTLTYPNWDTKGEVCIEQTDPLPAQVLGVIVEVTPGDTGR